MQAKIPASRIIDLPRSEGAVRLFLGLPTGDPPPAGWPLLVVLDGNRTFPLAVYSARTQALRPVLTHVEPAIVLGVGYADESAVGLSRTRDLTPPAPPERLRPRPNGRPWSEIGGAPAFLDFLRDEILPRIGSDYPVDTERLSLFGHSLGGLFALHTVFTDPGLFRCVIASSPSLWFGDGIVTDALPGLGARLARAGGRRGLMLSVGSEEQRVPPERAEAVGAAYVAWVAGNRMVDNVTELAERLRPREADGLDLTFRVWPDETHVTAPAVAMGQGVRLALRPVSSTSRGLS